MAWGSMIEAALARARIDPYILALLVTVATASLLPARGVFFGDFHTATSLAIGGWLGRELAQWQWLTVGPGACVPPVSRTVVPPR